MGVGICSDPMAVFYRIHNHLMTETTFYGEHFDTKISPSAKIADSASISVKDVLIGARSVIEAGVVIYGGTRIGDDVVLRSGVIVGGEGFETKIVGGKQIIIPHAGGVRLSNRVEILCNTHIAKSVYGGYTEVGEDTKIDAQVHIAHNVCVGKSCEIAAGAIIAGSSTIGDRVWIGPGVILSSEVSIGSGAYIALGSVVTKNVPAAWRVFGVPARRLP